ncbi:MAG: branched-chain amino acid ABC transporter permease [Deltaproteobacteria bacterium]
MYRPCGVFDETYSESMAIVRTRGHWAILILGLALVLTMPLYLSGRVLHFINLVGITMIAAEGLNLLTGFAGQISLGTSAFMAVGAYSSALLTTHAGFPVLLALPCSAVITGVVGVIFGAPSLRIKGFYLAMATLAAQMIIPWLIMNVRTDLTGGSNAMLVGAPKIGHLTFSSQQAIFYIIIPIAGLTILFVRNLARTRVGRAFVAVRDNDLAAEMMGISLMRYKLLAFFLSSFYAGVAGCLWAHWLRAISPDQFNLMESIWFLGMIIVGGMGSVIGVAFAVIFIKLFDIFITVFSPSLTSFLSPQLAQDAASALSPFVFGMIILIFLIWEPRGLSHRWEIGKAYFRLWPFKY